MMSRPTALSIPQPWTVETLARHLGLPVGALERLCHQFRLPAKAYLGGGQIPLSAQAATTFTEKDVTDLLAIHAALVAGQPLAQVLKQWQQSQSLKSIAAPKESGNFRSALANAVQAKGVSPPIEKPARVTLSATLLSGGHGHKMAKKPMFTQLLDELPKAPKLTVDELNQRYAKSEKSTLMETQENLQPELPLPKQPNSSNDDPLDALFNQPAQPRLPMTQLPGLAKDAIHLAVNAYRPPAMLKVTSSSTVKPATVTESKSLVAAFNAHRQAVKSRRQPR